jgi:hypothetical protein
LHPLDGFNRVLWVNGEHWERDEYAQDDPVRPPVERASEPQKAAKWKGRGGKGDRKAQAARYRERNRGKLRAYAKEYYKRTKGTK